MNKKNHTYTIITEKNCEILCAKELKEGSQTLSVKIEEGIPNDMMGLDIGKESVSLYRKILLKSQTIFWNGPLGVFEIPPFDYGTKEIALSIKEATKNKDILTLIGGGESALASKMYGIDMLVNHVSTGGGALLELLEGKELPGIKALTSK